MHRVPLKQILTIGMLPSFLKKIYYRIKGYKIGNNVKFAFGSVLIVKDKCIIGDKTKFGLFSVVICNEIIVGYKSTIRSITLIYANKIKIGSFVQISEMVIIRAGHYSEKSNICIEDKVHIFPHVIIDPSYPIHIGEETGVGFYSSIYTHGSYKNILDGYPVVYGEVNIGKRVELTYSVFVAPNVNIGDDTIVAYGSYVNCNIESGVLAAGLPAKVKRTKEQVSTNYNEEDKIQIINNILEDFINYLKFKYRGKAKIIMITSFSWNIILSNQTFNIYFLTNKLKEIKVEGSNKILILFNTKEIHSMRNEYFDLVSFECGNIRSNIAIELRRYFGRYGIRFTEYSR